LSPLQYIDVSKASGQDRLIEFISPMRMGTQEVSAYTCAPQQENNTHCTKVIKDQRNYCTKSKKNT